MMRWLMMTRAVAEAVTAEAVKTANYDSPEAAKEDGTAFVFMGVGTSHTSSEGFTARCSPDGELGYDVVHR